MPNCCGLFVVATTWKSFPLSSLENSAFVSCESSVVATPMASQPSLITFTQSATSVVFGGGQGDRQVR